MTIHFDDPQLELVVREKIRQYEGGLDAQTLSSITELDATDCGIRSLRGIDSMFNLRSLRLNSNPITDLYPLLSLANLRALLLRNCDVADLNALSQMIVLEILDLGRGRDQDVIRVPTIVTLDMQPMVRLVRLRALYLGGNRTANLVALTSSNALEVLDLHWTECKDTDLKFLAGLPRLKDLSLSENNLEQLPSRLEKLLGLRRLDISDNPITDLEPLRSLRHLQWLDARETKVSDWSAVDSVPTVLGRPLTAETQPAATGDAYARMLCPECSNPTRWIEQYRRVWCDTCRRYL